MCFFAEVVRVRLIEYLALAISWSEAFKFLVRLIFQKSGLKPPTSVGKDPIVRRRRSKPLNPSTLVGGGSV